MLSLTTVDFPDLDALPDMTNGTDNSIQYFSHPTDARRIRSSRARQELRIGSCRVHHHQLVLSLVGMGQAARIPFCHHVRVQYHLLRVSFKSFGARSRLPTLPQVRVDPLELKREVRT